LFFWREKRFPCEEEYSMSLAPESARAFSRGAARMQRHGASAVGVFGAGWRRLAVPSLARTGYHPSSFPWLRFLFAMLSSCRFVLLFACFPLLLGACASKGPPAPETKVAPPAVFKAHPGLLGQPSPPELRPIETPTNKWRQDPNAASKTFPEPVRPEVDF
jgi:hypothetical protein